MASGASSAAPPLPPAHQEKLDTLQRHNAELRALVAKHSTFEAQHTENSMVRAELDNLRADEPVFKLYGKMLVKQDPAEARATVSQRIKMIESELCVSAGALLRSSVRRATQLHARPTPPSQIKIRQANSRGASGASSGATTIAGLRGRGCSRSSARSPDHRERLKKSFSSAAVVFYNVFDSTFTRRLTRSGGTAQMEGGGKG